jgi:signal transduction histidine kinase
VSADAGAVTPDELRTLFLFESLDDEQLGWLAAHGRVERFPAGSAVYREGEPAESFFVLLDGALSLARRIGQDDVEINRTDHRGVYAGATQAYVQGGDVARNYVNSVRAVTECRFFVLDAADFAGMMRHWYPMAIHLLEGLFFGMRTTDAVVGQRERLLALGALSAGLTHELNNPAAASVRAASTLRERVAEMRRRLGELADGHIGPDQLRALTEVQETVIARIADAPALSPVQMADREDELGEWLQEQGVADGWDLAPVLVAAGVDVECVGRIADSVGPDLREQALRWLTTTVEAELLLGEITDAGERISSLVGAAKQYSQLDRAPYQRLDLHDGLDSTLAMLAHKMGDGVSVVRDYDRALPAIPGYPAELNQVWTNIIDNALQAMGGHGTLTVRTALADERALVEIGDTGPGIPPEIQRRIFEPFFTTKPAGEGTGLGLDISYRIVVRRHHGDLAVVSAPGDTRFQVRLPLTEGPEPAGQAAVG